MNTTTVRPSRNTLVDCVHTATTAPSLHNSQPWRFRIEGAAVEVYADPARRLDVVDPAGREQLISLGAAVFTLRLAIQRAGYHVELTTFPRPDEPDLVARVVGGRPVAVNPATEALAEAIPHRHTNRRPFAQTPVPPEALHHLVDAARREGAVLTVASPAGRDQIMAMAFEAGRRLRDRPGYREELDRWTGYRPRHDGVPVWAVGPWDALEAVPVRDFGELSELRRPVEPFEPYPTILVLSTDGDRRPDWLRAGQALQRVLLTATWQNLATTPISQPVEVPEVRKQLSDAATGLHAQMVLRVGYGKVAGRSPRRPVSEVLLPDRAP
ncbi:nitroreductase family protein [Actinoplanes sp. KI2]|uniref:Acg family FMN-binding oxidoreductase n=1 Tax=Actinoplanes sp. KI2 TaxID=2983315 RepID=UPI0021D57B3B|nr:nitroreductase family protein [Actinoplanes sp. KI2]MCU7729526.1 nitroreductase family protein [Actinoplanes sp. KI2]